MTNKPHARSIFLFHRDLRCDDNCGLIAARAESQEVIPLFILDPRQIQPHSYRSEPGLHFLKHSLEELDAALRERGSSLFIMHGDPISVLGQLHATLHFDAIYSNRDYTPFARRRDKEISIWTQAKGIAFHMHRDALLTEPEEVKKADGSPYTVYTAFAKKAATVQIASPQPLSDLPAASVSIGGTVRFEEVVQGYRPAPRAYRYGGRKEALSLLESLVGLEHYAVTRDLPFDEQGTSGISAHLKFGTLSPREVYQRIHSLFGSTHLIVRELLWRDFFHHIGRHYPHVFQGAFHQRYDAIAWENDPSQFSRWQEGLTGFPIVDAGMRQLFQTGFMHNRVRMIVASFLTKDLHIDWHWGERHFARHLQDYDPAVNNGNWQWAASTGCDAQPYFRIFNPWLQQKKFDPECSYIKRWIPELRDRSSIQIHSLADQHRPLTSGYPPPMVDHAEARLTAEELYSSVAKKG